uniref:Uncharacterized protein LOC8281241 n=1 Tax=Rhizophora mucronata TaxID=61149 RepID=A0A2P2KTW6_RHIMU
MSAEQSFLSKAQYSSPVLISSLILFPLRSKQENPSSKLKVPPFPRRMVAKHTRLYLPVRRPRHSSCPTSGLKGSVLSRSINLVFLFPSCISNRMTTDNEA